MNKYISSSPPRQADSTDSFDSLLPSILIDHHS